MYITHISRIFDMDSSNIFYNIFSIIFVKLAMLHPLKYSKLSSTRWHHQSVSRTKDTGICLPTKWILDYNSIACFPTIGNYSLSFLDLAWAFLAWQMLTAQYIFCELPLHEKVMSLCKDCQLTGRDIPSSFVRTLLLLFAVYLVNNDWLMMSSSTTEFGRFFRGGA